MNIQNKKDLLTRDEQYVWHGMRPFSPQATTVFTKGDGVWLEDIDGNRYLDAMSGLWSVNVGYGRKELAEAAYNQLNELPFYPLTQSHVPAIELAEKLNGLLGDEYVIFFSNSGSEANETAFKIARQYHAHRGEHQRYKFIARYRGYHGNSMGALSATGQAQRKYMYEPLAPGFLHVAPPDCYRNTYTETGNPQDLECVKAINDVMTWEMSETIAAVIMEPIITGGGILMPPEDYLQGVYDVCQKHGALLIIDEVICGFGRTGEMFGFMNYGIKPDIISMAKGITSSYLPLSATAVKKEIFESFKGTDAYQHLRHVNTFGGHPAACAVALKNIEIIERENLVARSKVKGAELLHNLQKQLGNHPNVGDIRGKGLLVGIELVENCETKQPLAVSKVNSVVAACKAQGVLVGKNGDTVAGYNNIIQLSPPLSITDEELQIIIKTLTHVMNAQLQ